MDRKLLAITLVQNELIRDLRESSSTIEVRKVPNCLEPAIDIYVEHCGRKVLNIRALESRVKLSYGRSASEIMDVNMYPLAAKLLEDRLGIPAGSYIKLSFGDDQVTYISIFYGMPCIITKVIVTTYMSDRMFVKTIESILNAISITPREN
jgi:hypothetical protein